MSNLMKAAEAVRGAGRYGDDQLVHVSSRELAQLADAWGDPTINPETGLPEFFLAEIANAVSSVLGPVGQIAGAVAPLLGMIPGIGPTMQQGAGALGQMMSPQAAVQPGVRNQTTGEYEVTPPTNTQATTGGLSKLFGPNFWSNALPAAALTAIDYLSQPDPPSVAKQLRQLQNAVAASNPHWATPLPEVEYDRQVAMPAEDYDWSQYAYGPEADFFTGDDTPRIKKAMGGRSDWRSIASSIAPPVRPRLMDRINPPAVNAGTMVRPPIMERFLPVAPRLPRRGPIDPTIPHGVARGGLAQMREAGRYYRGPGDGESDSIPAMLSDGEFVLPAGFVADYGRGSNDAGADKLERKLKSWRSGQGAKI